MAKTADNVTRKDRPVSGEAVLTATEKVNTKSRFRATVVIALALLVLAFLIALSVGRYHIDFGTTISALLNTWFGIGQPQDNMTNAVIFTLRLPRSVAAILIGGALALSGACYQSIFKNPLVSPDLLGVSSGACVGAALAILMSLGSFYIQLFAFIAGIATVLATTSIPKLLHNESTMLLVLSGVIMSSLMSAIMSIIKVLADTDTQLAEITYWTMGSLSAIELADIASVLPTILIPAVVILVMRFRLNVMALGDREAKTLGINLQRTRMVFIICATLLTASCVCLAGSIGWVGLVIPHVARLIVGADNKRMLPVAMLFGSVFMLVIDTLCRTLSSSDLRISILTGIIGAPFFFFILVKQHKSMHL